MIIQRAMTYARGRLWLGVAGIGTMVVLAAAALWFRLPERWLGGARAGVGQDLSYLAAVYAVYALVSFPFDWLGGYWLPCRFGRFCQMWPMFVVAWLRGVLMQGTFMVLAGAGVLAAGRWGGLAMALVLLTVAMAVMLHLQGWLARVVGGIAPITASLGPVEEQLQAWHVQVPRVDLLTSTDPGFVGGWTGLPGWERLAVPLHWVRSLPAEFVALQILRRVGVLRSGSRGRGILVAVLWNLVGFTIAAQLPGAGVASVAEVLATGLWFTLWSFGGLLLLPSVSRPGVLEGDRFAMEAGASAGVICRTMQEMDQLQDDEPERTKWVERVFHPVPSVQKRVESLARDERTSGAWQAARLALYLSWPCLGFLSRAVHCNAGRPELWVMLPGD